jgi:hypothetical protein
MFCYPDEGSVPFSIQEVLCYCGTLVENAYGRLSLSPGQYVNLVPPYITVVYWGQCVEDMKKVNLSLLREGVWGSGYIGSRFLDLGTSWN